MIPVPSPICRTGSPTALATMARWGMEKRTERGDDAPGGGDENGLSSSAGAFAYYLDYIGDFLRDIPSLILDLQISGQVRRHASLFWKYYSRSHWSIKS